MPKTIHQSQLTVHYNAARLYHSTASVWLSVDPLSDKYPGVSPYVYCAGNPVRLVDPDGRFSRESRAIKYHNRAVKRYGKDRVGDVAVQAGTTSKPNYVFSIYNNDGDKERTWSSSEKSGVSVNAIKGNCISSGRDYRKYSGTGLNLKIRFSIGAQASGKIGKYNVSANINSIDLIWGQTGRDGTKWDRVNDYGETTLRRGVSLGPLYYNYEKALGKDPTHSYGVEASGKYGESANMGVSGKREFNFSAGIAIIFGLHLDANYKW